MRKIIIGLLILVACIFSFYLYSYGFSGINSMTALREQKDEYDGKVAIVESEKEKYTSAKDNLRIALASFTTAKEQYEQVSKYASSEAQEQAALGDYYDLEYLWTILGTYAVRENVELGLVCTTSSTPSDNEDYIYADLNFTVEGEYRPISDFVEDCEDDEGLEFSISKFKLVPYEPKDAEEELEKANYVVATFVVRDVPLSRETLELINNQVEDSPEAQGLLSGDSEESNTDEENSNTTESEGNNTTTNETSSEETNSTENNEIR